MNPSNEVTERERALFEVAFADKLDFLRLSPDAEYLYSETGHAWDGWQARASLPQSSAKACEIVTCVGKGGVYQHIGVAMGAGTRRGAEDLDIYGDKATGLIYYRTRIDYRERMQPVAPTVPAIPRTSAEAVAWPEFKVGAMYDSTSHGPVKFVGMDTFHGETTYCFQPSHGGNRYWGREQLSYHFATPAPADSAAERDAARWRYVRDTETLENYVWEALEGIGLAPDGVLDQAAYAASMDAAVDRAIAAMHTTTGKEEP